VSQVYYRPDIIPDSQTAPSKHSRKHKSMTHTNASRPQSFFIHYRTLDGRIVASISLTPVSILPTVQPRYKRTRPLPYSTLSNAAKADHSTRQASLLQVNSVDFLTLSISVTTIQCQLSSSTFSRATMFLAETNHFKNFVNTYPSQTNCIPFCLHTGNQQQIKKSIKTETIKNVLLKTEQDKSVHACKLTCRFVSRRPDSGFCINMKQIADLTVTTHTHVNISVDSVQ